MHYSPVRYSIIANGVQLACFRPAASVRSEPGSNSHIYLQYQKPSCASSITLLKVLTETTTKTLPYIYITFFQTFAYTLQPVSLPVRLIVPMHLTASSISQKKQSTTARASVSSSTYSLCLKNFLHQPFVGAVRTTIYKIFSLVKHFFNIFLRFFHLFYSTLIFKAIFIILFLFTSKNMTERLFFFCFF